MQIAFLEDDDAHARTVVDWLVAAGHEVSHVGTGPDMMSLLRRRSFDLLLFDWMVPGLDGADLLAWVRKSYDSRIPVVFLTAVDSEASVARVLDLGADDYVVKPPRRQELLARIGAVLRRSNVAAEGKGRIQLSPYAIDLDRRVATLDGRELPLTSKEFELAAYLFANAGRLLSRDQLLRAVWGLNERIATRTLDTHVSAVRKKLELTPRHGYRIVSVYNFGYRLEAVTDPVGEGR